MKRTRFLSRTPLKRSTPLASTRRLRRTPFARKSRRPREGDDPKYLAWVRTHPCCVGGRSCQRSVAHHAIEMGGQELAGMGSTAPDSRTLPLCRLHHRQFHRRQGFCKDWSPNQRRVFQELEIERLRTIWADREAA